MAQSTTVTAKSIIDQLSKELVWSTRPDGTKFVKRDVEGYPEDDIHNIIFEAISDHDLDTGYEMLYDIVNHIQGYDCENIDSMRESLYEIESDVYTSDLTAWLNKSNHHVYYLTEVMEEMDCKDGFQLLSMAQHRQIEEIGDSLLRAIEERTEE